MTYREIVAVQKLIEEELKKGVSGKASWHHQYHDSAYIYVGSLDDRLTEGDVIAVFSQFGDIIDINLVRDGKTGKSKGFAFIAYRDQRVKMMMMMCFSSQQFLLLII
jgi:RNA-binding motif protein, X-linked 2